MKVYLIRHGKSEGNKARVHQTNTSSLSKEGVSQAKSVAKWFEKIDIEAILSSPHLRAKDTAEIINDRKKLKVEYLKELGEVTRPSELDNLSWDSPKSHKIKDQIKTNRNNPRYKYSDEETFEELLKRADKIIKRIKTHPKGNVLIVSHITFTVLLIMRLIYEKELTPKIFYKFFGSVILENTGITTIENSELFGWSLSCFNDTNHLTNDH